VNCVRESVHHRQQIKTSNLRFLPVSKHIHACAKDSFKIFPIYKMKNNSITDRKQKESFFIKMLNPIFNINE